jgi:hypothetical protein
LDDDRDLDAATDDLANRVMNRQAVGHIAAGTVDVQRNRTRIVVGEFAKPLDHPACRVFFDVADEVNVAKPVRRLLSEHALDSVDQFANEAIVQLPR